MKKHFPTRSRRLVQFSSQNRKRGYKKDKAQACFTDYYIRAKNLEQNCNWNANVYLKR